VFVKNATGGYWRRSSIARLPSFWLTMKRETATTWKSPPLSLRPRREPFAMSNSNTATINASHLDLAARAQECATRAGLGPEHALALSAEIDKRAKAADGATSARARVLYASAGESLTEHTDKRSALAALDAYLLSLIDAGSPFDVLDPCKAGELERPSFLVEQFCYRGKLHLLFGRDGTNKSMLIIWTLATLASLGKHVLLIEYEMDENAVGVQLEEMGFDREALRPYFHQVAPNHAFSAELLEGILGALPGCEAVALDNVAEAIASAGGGSNGDENAARDALIVLAPLRDLAHREDGPAVIAADHLPHARDNAARGTTAKGALTDVAFQVETPHPVTRTRTGDIKLTCRKDRPSLIGKGTELWHTVGDGEGGLPIKRIATPGDLRDELSEDGASMILGLERYATAHEGREWLSRPKVYDQCGLSKSLKRDAELARLANDETQPIEQRVEARGEAAAATQYRFREVEDHAPALAM
jgi:hypothetical protein